MLRSLRESLFVSVIVASTACGSTSRDFGGENKNDGGTGTAGSDTDHAPMVAGGRGGADPTMTDKGGGPKAGGAPGTGEGGMGGEESADTTPPTIVSTTPADGASAVFSDSNIQITFSEAMDRPSTVAAFSSNRLTASDVAFSWDSSGRVLTVVPKAPLAYAEGSSNDIKTLAANAYKIAFSSNAKDATGNPLAPTSFEFSSARRFTTILTSLDALDGYVTAPDYGDPYAGMVVGDDAKNQPTKGFCTFDISELPPDLLRIDAALFSAYGGGCNGITADFKAIKLSHVTFATLSYMSAAANAATLTAPTLHDLGSLGTLPGAWCTLNDYSWREADATVAVADDFAKRAVRSDRSQYMLWSSVLTNNNDQSDTVFFYTATWPELVPKLSVKFLMK